MKDDAAELRRLHQFAEDRIGRATAAEAALQMTKATHALKLAAVEAQRDALLEACKAYDQWADKTLCYDRELRPIRAQIRAAIKNAEGGQ
jgi:hypothetical protein